MYRATTARCRHFFGCRPQPSCFSDVSPDDMIRHELVQFFARGSQPRRSCLERHARKASAWTVRASSPVRVASASRGEQHSAHCFGSPSRSVARKQRRLLSTPSRHTLAFTCLRSSRRVARLTQSPPAVFVFWRTNQHIGKRRHTFGGLPVNQPSSGTSHVFLRVRKPGTTFVPHHPDGSGRIRRV